MVVIKHQFEPENTLLSGLFGALKPPPKQARKETKKISSFRGQSQKPLSSDYIDRLEIESQP